MRKLSLNWTRYEDELGWYDYAKLAKYECAISPWFPLFPWLLYKVEVHEVGDDPRAHQKKRPVLALVRAKQSGTRTMQWMNTLPKKEENANAKQ
jgi:hypothetical protein